MVFEFIIRTLFIISFFTSMSGPRFKLDEMAENSRYNALMKEKIVRLQEVFFVVNFAKYEDDLLSFLNRGAKVCSSLPQLILTYECSLILVTCLTGWDVRRLSENPRGWKLLLSGRGVRPPGAAHSFWKGGQGIRETES